MNILKLFKRVSILNPSNIKRVTVISYTRSSGYITISSSCFWIFYTIDFYIMKKGKYCILYNKRILIVAASIIWVVRYWEIENERLCVIRKSLLTCHSYLLLSSFSGKTEMTCSNELELNLLTRINLKNQFAVTHWFIYTFFFGLSTGRPAIPEVLMPDIHWILNLLLHLLPVLLLSRLSLSLEFFFKRWNFIYLSLSYSFSNPIYKVCVNNVYVFYLLSELSPFITALKLMSLTCSNASLTNDPLSTGFNSFR